MVSKPDTASQQCRSKIGISDARKRNVFRTFRKTVTTAVFRPFDASSSHASDASTWFDGATDIISMSQE
jgi:hypothetical protein